MTKQEKWNNKQRKLALENKHSQANFKAREFQSRMRATAIDIEITKAKIEGNTWKPSKRVKLNHQSKNMDVDKFIEAVKIAKANRRKS